MSVSRIFIVKYCIFIYRTKWNFFTLDGQPYESKLEALYLSSIKDKIN